MLQLLSIINCACNEFRSWEVGFVSLRFSQGCVLRNIKLTGNGEYDVFRALNGTTNDILSWYYKADSCGFVQEICPGNQ